MPDDELIMWTNLYIHDIENSLKNYLFQEYSEIM